MSVGAAPAARPRGHRGPALVAVGVGLLAAAPWLLGAFQLTLLANIGLAALVVLGLVVLSGIAGMTSFGQAAFVGLGAYTTAWLGTAPALPAALAWAGGSPLATLGCVLVLTTAVALLLGALTLRLSGHYLPLATIAWGLALYSLFGTSTALGGHTGIADLPALVLGPWRIDRPGALCGLVWGVVLVALLLLRNLLDSRSGRAIRALRGGQAMAASMGVDVLRAKLAVFLLAAGLAGLSGWLYAYTQRFVSPEPFGLAAGIDYLFMALIGGAGHLSGALLGAAVFTFAKNGLQDALPALVGRSGSFDAIVFGLLVIFLLHRAPQGLAGVLAALWRRRALGGGGKQAGVPFGVPVGVHVGVAIDGAADGPGGAASAVAARSSPGSTPAPAPLPRRDLPPRGTPVLEVRGLTRRFGGLIANDAVDLDLAAGEILAVIGPNGAGKSTLFNQLACCDVPSAGRIRLLGRDVAGWRARRAAAAGLVRTFQHVRLLPTMSVLENVALGAHLRGRAGLLRSALRLDRAEEAALLGEARRQLERVGLGTHALAPAGSLALGQQRLVEIARALAADPCVLLLDEPAAGLRHLEKRALATLLRSLRDEGVAVLLVEHDMDFVMNLVDRVSVFVFGAKIAEGLPDAVQRDPAVLQAYLGGEG